MAGFKLITEARDFILHLNKKNQSGPLGYVFAPVSNFIRFTLINDAEIE